MYVFTNSTAVRIAFRIVFFILSVYLSAVGSLSNKLSLKLRLLQSKRIPVPEAAGWMQGTAIFEPIIRTRRIPNWRWWVVMAAVMALVKIDDLLTNIIREEYIQTLCAFDTGMVLSSDGSGKFYVPPWNGKSALVAGNAQLLSVEHGCEQGIYRKVNEDYRFCAASTDIIGSWNCSAIGEDQHFPYGVDDDPIIQKLADDQLLYGDDSEDHRWI